jgi:hypothetical protein
VTRCYRNRGGSKLPHLPRINSFCASLSMLPRNRVDARPGPRNSAPP